MFDQFLTMQFFIDVWKKQNILKTMPLTMDIAHPYLTIQSRPTGRRLATGQGVVVSKYLKYNKIWQWSSVIICDRLLELLLVRGTNCSQQTRAVRNASGLSGLTTTLRVTGRFNNHLLFLSTPENFQPHWHWHQHHSADQDPRDR